MDIKKYAHKITKYISDPDYRFIINANRGKYDSMPDEEFLARRYKAQLKKPLDLKNAETFNQKLQWLKLYDRKPEYTEMVDKYAVKKYVAGIIGDEYIIPTLGVWDDPEKIDFNALPDKFVLKCNHNSGRGMYICRDKNEITDKKAREIIKGLKEGLNENYYIYGREWPYKNVKRRVIAESYLEDGSGSLTDYKVHNFSGRPEFILVCRGRFSKGGMTEDFYSPDWEKLDLRRPGCPNSSEILPKPEQLEEMLSLSARLSENVPFLRTDFYIAGGKIYFSELTFYPASGFSGFVPEGWDRVLGEKLVLPD